MFYSKLEQICKEKGLSVTDLATKAGLSQGVVTGWKNGVKPQNKTIKAIADCLDIPISSLSFSAEPEKYPNGFVTNFWVADEHLQELITLLMNKGWFDEDVYNAYWNATNKINSEIREKDKVIASKNKELLETQDKLIECKKELIRKEENDFYGAKRVDRGMTNCGNA
jgi:transcriptional regulator with XRE-family HTH domain